MKSRMFLAVFAAMLLAAVPAMAQEVASRMTGQVIDQNGNPIAGATVEIVHEPTGAVRFTDTLANGRFSAQGLRVCGPYRVTAYKDGFQAQTVEGVSLRLGETETVNLAMFTAAELDRITVTGQAIPTQFMADNMGTGTTIGRNQIENFATISRSINDFLRFDPRITVVDKDRNELSIAGSNNRFNNVLIDGVTANDSFGLIASGQPAVRQPIAIDWLEEISVQISPYDVTQTGATGGIVNSVTKSGTNEFSGRLYGQYRDENFVGEDEFGNDFNDFDDWTVGGYLSGPIIPNRLFFFAGHERARINFSGAAANVGLRGDDRPTIFDTDPADIEEIIDIAQNVWGFDPGDAGPARLANLQENSIIKLDWDINDQHRLSARYTRSEGEQSTFRRRRTDFDLTSAFFDQAIDYESWTGQFFSDWTGNFSTEFRFTYTDFESVFNNASRLPQIEVITDGGLVRFGTEQFRHANELGVETTYLFGKGNYFTGQHSIDFGFDWQEEDYSNLFVESSLGRYRFDSIDAFADGTGNLQYTLRVSSDPNDPLFPLAEFAWDVLGLFVQDTWTVTSDLTLNYGVRWEFFNTDDEPLFNENFLNTFGFSNQGTVDGEDVFQPRVGFNYQPSQLDFRGQLRGGVGLFRGRTPGVWLTNPFSNPGGTIDVFTCDSRGNRNDCLELDPNFVFSPDPDNQPRLGATTPAQDVDVLEDGFTVPTEWKANLAWDMELPGIENSNLTIEVGKAWVKDGIFYQSLNLGDPQGFLPDGREHFWANVNTASGARAGRDRAFNDVILLKNTSKGERTNATVSLDKTWSGDWGRLFGRVSFNYQSSTEVNPGTSSRAISNFQNQAIFNPNEEVANRSIFEISQSFDIQSQYTVNWLPIGATRFSAFYQWRSGRPFSWTFNNDANGDNTRGNDLLFVPNPGDVRFVDASGNPDPAGEAAFFQLVDNVRDLRNSRGRAVNANRNRSSSVGQLDLRVAQDFELGWRLRGQVFFDIENFTNLLNDDWGQIDQVAFPFRASPVDFMGVDPETGQMLYRWLNRGTERSDFESRQDNIGESRWRAQIGLRFEF